MPDRPYSFPIWRYLIGVVLLAAAGLKLYGFAVSPIPKVGWYSAPDVQTVAVTWEILLGVWLMSGWLPVGSWGAATSTFTVFAAVSGLLGWQGVAHCNCFGHLPASPWYAFAVDLAVLAVLAAARPRLEALKPAVLRNGALEFGRAVVVVALLLGLAAAVAHLVCGSVELALSRLRGETVSVSSDYIDFGSGRPGETLTSVVRVFNRTDVPVKMVGGSSDCSCVTTKDLPVEIAPGGSVELTIQLVLPRTQPGVFTRTAVLWTDHEMRRTIPLQLGSRVE
jgi:hypothetical protein